MNLFVYISSFMFGFSCVTPGAADEQEFRLIRDLFSRYDKRIRPTQNASESLNVTFGLALAQIIDVDEKNQIMTTNCWLNQVWVDYGLRWDPARYGDIRVIRIPYMDIWRPDILLYNNADVKINSAISTNAIVTSDGNVTWLSMVIFRSSCTIHVRYFPFDEQNCSMLFASWTYDGFQINLITNTQEGDISNYKPNSEWWLLQMFAKRNIMFYSCCTEPYPDITFYIFIQRRPLFYVFNMVLPCILITLVALLGFYVPSDSGEKVTMGITTLLSMTVFMMLVTDSMPPTSNVLPLIGLYYGITICIVSFATGMTVLTLNIHHKGTRGHEVPKVVKAVCFKVFARLFCMNLEQREIPCSTPTEYDPSAEASRPNIQHDVNTEYDPQQRNGSANSSRFTTFKASQPNSSPIVDNFEKQFMRVLIKVNQTIERNEIRLARQDLRDAIKLDWQQVAQVVDRVLLSCFVAATLTITFTLMFYAPHAKGNFYYV